MALLKAGMYKCSSKECDCLTEVLYQTQCSCGDDCGLSCCGNEMEQVAVKAPQQEGKEKHVPVVEKVPGGYKVKIGSVPHPMVEDHYIVLAELRAGKDVLRHYFKPGDAPEAVFKTDATEVVAREYCNKHGLWEWKK